MTLSENTIFIILTIISCFFLYVVNIIFRESKYAKFINIIFFIESLILIFLFSKYPSIIAFPILLVSTYFLFNNNYEVANSSIFSSSSSKNLFAEWFVNKFKFFSIILIISIPIYEILSDFSFSTNSLSVIVFSALLYFYDKMYTGRPKEINFLVIFSFLFVIIFVVSPIIYKLFTNQVGETITGEGWFNDVKIVNLFLARPLESLLNLLGYPFFSSGQDIYYTDLQAGFTRKVGIAESCSGIYSILLFLIAFLSYTIVEYRDINSETLSFLLFGLILAYLSNLIRMALIILAGHYYGHDSLIFVHKYLGWLIFTSWCLLFWFIYEKFNSNLLRYKI